MGGEEFDQPFPRGKERESLREERERERGSSPVTSIWRASESLVGYKLRKAAGSVSGLLSEVKGKDRKERERALQGEIED